MKENKSYLIGRDGKGIKNATGWDKEGNERRGSGINCIWGQIFDFYLYLIPLSLVEVEKMRNNMYVYCVLLIYGSNK